MDIIDQISQGRSLPCPYDKCDAIFEDIDPAVANALRLSHIRRKHPFEEE